MFISLKEIRNLFSDYPCIICDSKQPFCLDKYRIIFADFQDTEYNLHCLYVINDPDILRKYSKIPDLTVLYLTPLQEDLTFGGIDRNFRAIMKLQTDDINMVSSRLQKFFDKQYGIGLLSESLLEILFFEGGIQAMVERVYPAFENPIYVFDNNFQLIASTWDAGIDMEQGKGIIDNGGFTDREYEILNLSHAHKKMQASEFPIKITHPVFGYDQLLCTINTHKDMGHIVINGLNRNLTNMDQQMLYLLKKAIDQQMKKDEFIRNNRGFHYENFLKDLLDGKIAVGKQFAHRMNYVKEEFSGNLYCMVIETARSSSTLNTMHVRSLFETTFPNTMTLMYNGGIIILLRLPGQQILQADDYRKISDICLEYGLYAGMGNCFQNILHLPEYYHQGLRSIELGICQKNEPSLFLYQDYYLSHMTTVFAQKESPETFCHPQLKILLDYDKKNGTNLSYILYMWLICERNSATAAQTMYMHRNTLVYRLKKINSLISVDYESYLERQHIILSYELIKNETLSASHTLHKTV